MAIATKMIGQLIFGNRHERVQAGATMGMWFAAAAFVCSTAASYAERLLANDLSENTIAVVGGVVCAAVAACFKAA